MSATDSLAGWLGSRSDARLVALLQLRPDLAVPLPSSMTVLAARAEQRASVLRATEELDTLDFAIIESLAVHGTRQAPGDGTPLTRKALHAHLKGRATKAAVDAALERLTDRALVWTDGEALHLVPAAAEALPWPMGSATELSDALTEPEVHAALAEITPPERALLDKLATTGPRGRTRDAAPDAPTDRPVPRLLARGLLRRVDDETVELPVTVGQVLRREPVTAPSVLTPPKPPSTKHTPAEVNAVAAGEVGELLRHCADILAALSESPAPALRAGGLGVRELRRIAKQTGIDETRAGLLVEVLAAAKLIEKGIPEPPPDIDSVDDFWAPTPASDGWLESPPARRWTVLAMVWLDLDRMPWMIGMRDTNDKPLAALSVELRVPHAPRDRRAILGLLAEQPTGTALDPADLGRVLAWRQPRRRRQFRREAVEHTLAEAAALGLLGRGALASPARALLHGAATSAADAEAEMAAALPEPVDHVLVQADLTVVAPGPLVPELAQRIALVADVESAGAATVYRIGESSVRRALDAGLTAAELHALFATHSRTPVPQALTYLIDDVARRHGQLRAGMAQSFVRSDDPALLAQVLSAPVAGVLALRAVAPTVAISQAPLGEVLEQLRAAGFAPAGEDSAGGIVDLRPRGARIATRPNARQSYRPNPPTTEQLELLVAELRAGERAASARAARSVRTDGTRTSTAATLALLQLAARVRRPVNIGYVDAQGVASQRVVEPLKVGNGQLDALDPVTGTVRHFTLHRIASVALLE
ncbi:MULTISPECIES: helicase-associated domain-containing protein [Nocardia]|uniref:helicase-associated domain-containing protein n=1 Tax=Nocardia TaxID=1817 RepID=UPI000BF0050D|nr:MULTISPECIES: helicase-associated domain-containing protein [Nocardia]MBF6187103.1 helicase-associated domain-containing protein [Nocardia farcinica]MBF6312751.1 helicase-associated domain-containing protein [Nocardia farcinica]MBF6408394.1 helicase-associated domain-containing protein [Nocardia farcinica]PEH78863.1 DNA-binding protein [Nocardia sp. FDAARGOS_372]UEX23482.1 helicase-associated domain-containing protein [Nocardia farcinica]